jgi:hypothetical protein
MMHGTVYQLLNSQSGLLCHGCNKVTVLAPGAALCCRHCGQLLTPDPDYHPAQFPPRRPPAKRAANE